MRGCFKFIVNAVVLLAVLAIGAAVAAYFYVLPTVDTMLADAVRRDLMLPPSSTVEIQRGSLIDTYQGQVQGFLVESKEAKVEGLVVEDVRLIGRGIEFDLLRTLATGQAELKRVDNADLSFRVSEQALADRWSRDLAKKGFTDIEIDLDDEDIDIKGKLDLKIMRVDVGAKGKFEVDGSQRIRLRVSDLDLGGSTLGMGIAKSVFSTLIPAVDLGGLKMGVGITRLEPKDGYLEVEARSVDLKDLANAMKDKPEEESDDTIADKVEDTLKEAGREIGDFTDKVRKKLK